MPAKKRTKKGAGTTCAAPPKRRKPSAKQSSAKSANSSGVILTDGLVALGYMRDGQDKFELLEDVLERSAFWKQLEKVRRRARVRKQALRILIKPDLAFFNNEMATATDPQLVEHLIDLLYQQGYENCAVGQSCDSSSLWLENRDVIVLADLLGYQFVTPAGHPYEIIDLAEQSIVGQFEPGSVLYGVALSRSWIEADFRICFNRNKTHPGHFYSLCLDGLIDLLAKQDKASYERDDSQPQSILASLQRHYPADYCLIDAITSNHGVLGGQLVMPLQTNTLIGGHNALLVDSIAARKMGLDPRCSPNHDFVTREIPPPEPCCADGDLAPYPNWQNADRLLADATCIRQKHGALDRMTQPWLQEVDETLFPFKDPLNERVNSIISKLLVSVPTEPRAYWLLVAASYILAWLSDGLEAMRIMYWKDNLQWREVVLNIHPDDYQAGEYEEIESYLDDTLAPHLNEVERDENGLRWCFIEDDSVVFDFVQRLPIDFDSFTNKVDVSKAIQMMNDYIGGLICVLDSDEQQRPVRQMERNLYLPQPNYLALYQGKSIDVSKLEYVRYEGDQHCMSWKTVYSENGSAEYDDGYVRFTRTDDNETEVCVFGRQKFTLPPLLEFMNSEIYRPLKTILTRHAYTLFFTTTVRNFAAVYEGREIRIGKPNESYQVDQGYESGSQLVMGLAEKLKDLLQIDDLSSLIDTQPKTEQGETGYVDDDGFVHGVATDVQTGNAPGTEQGGLVQSLLRQAQQASVDYYRDLGKAVSRDLQR